MYSKKILVFGICFCLTVNFVPLDRIVFAATKSQNNILEKIITKQSMVHKTGLLASIENNLNNREIFDEELETLTSKEINLMNTSEKIVTNTEYYSVNDTEIKKVTKDDINDAIADNNKNNTNDFANFNVQKASAKEKENNYMKVSLVYSESKGSLYVIGLQEWLTQPKNRSIDVYGIAIEGSNGARFENSTQNASYMYKYREKYKQNSKTLSDKSYIKTISPDSSKNMKYISDMGEDSSYIIGSAVNLKDDVYEATDEFTRKLTVNSQICRIAASVKKRKSTYVDFKSYYRHAKKKYSMNNLSFSVGLDSNGPSVEVTYTPGNKKVTTTYSNELNIRLSVDKYVC